MTARRAPAGILAGLAAGLALAACAGTPNQLQLSEPAAQAQAIAPQAQVQPAAPQDTRIASRVPANAAVEPARRALLPVAELRGMTSDQVSALLGLPQFQRHEAPVELWQYRGDGCVLHVFLYRTQYGLRVQYAEARSRAVASVANAALSGTPADECLAKLAAAQPGAAS